MPPARGMIDSGSLSVPPRVLDRPNGFMQFGFQENGSISLFMTALPQEIPLYLVICSEADQAKFGLQADEMCASLDNGDVCMVKSSFRDQMHFGYTLQRYGYYSFNLVNCHDKPVTVNVHAILLNPRGNHLTATLVPAPTMFAIMTVLWTLVTLMWGFHVILWWRASVGLHRTMIAYPAVKIVFTWYAFHYYTYIAQHGTSSPVNFLVYMGSYIVFQMIFNFILLVLSRGWGISRANLKSDKYYIFSILASMLIIMMFRYLYSASNQILELMIELGLIGFSVTIVVYVFMGVNHTIRQLETSVFNYNIDMQNIDTHYTLIKRHKIYVLLKVTMITWLGLNTGAFFTNLMLFEGSEPNWVKLMNTEFLDFILFAMIACNFRLRATPNLFLSGTSPSPTVNRSNNNIDSISEINNFGNSVTSDSVDNDSIEMVSLRSRTGSNSSDIDTPTPPTLLLVSDDVNDSGDNSEGEEDEVVLINKHR